MNNNLLAAIFIALAIVSATVNGWFFLATVDPTSHVTAQAQACVNAPPIPNLSGCGYATELTYWDCTAGVFDSFESNGRDWTDNTSLFNITDAGFMSFTPEYGSAGSYPILITVVDDSGCPNAIASTGFTLIIQPYPSNDTLDIWDETDNATRYKFDPISFYANYSDVQTNASIPNATCQIHYDYQNVSALSMTYNSTSMLYERHESSGFVQGTYDYNVTCDGLSEGYGIITRNDSFTITNRAPYLYAAFPNLTIQAGQAVSGYDLNDYFRDNDFDTLSFTETSPSVILVQIDNLGIVTITPNPSASGNYTIRFRASDGIASAQSNLVNIEVLPYSISSPGSAGGGGGGGGGGARNPPPPFCTPDWQCTDWRDCEPTGIQQRTCFDTNNCSTVEDRPPLLRECEYVGTCSDNIKNCHDGLCELGVDCGGPCATCATCFDGVKNQNEEGVDCGGVCDACDEDDIIDPTTDRPSPIDNIPEEVRTASYVGLIVGILAAVLMILASLYLHKNLFTAVGRWASNLVAPPHHEVSEHAQYLIAVEVGYEKVKAGYPRDEFLSSLAERTSELLAWTLQSSAELTFDELRELAAQNLSKNQAKHVAQYTALLETALYEPEAEVSDHALLHGSRKLAEHLQATSTYEQSIDAARSLKKSVKERLLSQLTEALVVLIEHDRVHAAQLLLEEADAYAEGLTGETAERYAAVREELS